jgi:hypothetical protein
MKIKINIFRTAFILVSFCLLSAISLGQTTFEDRTLNFLNEVAQVTTINHLESLMLKKKFVFIEKTVLENMGEAFVYKGGWGQEIMIAYSKDNKLVFATEQIASIRQFYIKIELEKNGFKMVSTTIQKDDDGNIETKWGKPEYPYKFVLLEGDNRFTYITLITKASKNF